MANIYSNNYGLEISQEWCNLEKNFISLEDRIAQINSIIQKDDEIEEKNLIRVAGYEVDFLGTKNAHLVFRKKDKKTDRDCLIISIPHSCNRVGYNYLKLLIPQNLDIDDFGKISKELSKFSDGHDKEEGHPHNMTVHHLSLYVIDKLEEVLFSQDKKMTLNVLRDKFEKKFPTLIFEENYEYIKEIYSGCIKKSNKYFNSNYNLELSYATLLHDIGKIGVPFEILNKPGALTDFEFEIVKKHSEIGYKMLEGIEGFELAASTVRHHHDRWMGGGYPGVGQKQIPFGALICSPCDVYDAMRSKRVYRDDKRC